MKEPIRVLQVCQRMEAAGVQSFIMNMYRNIDREKVQFDFLVHYKEEQFFDKEIRALGGKIYQLSVREDYNMFQYMKQLNDFFKSHQEYKIVHGHMDTLGAFYFRSAQKNGVPWRIAHAHNDSIQNGFKKPFRLIMIHLYSIFANKLMACSDKSGHFMFGNRKYLIFNNAIDSKKFRYNLEVRKKKRIELGLDGEIVIGNVGRFHVQKNQLFLIDVLKEYRKINPNVKLLLIGSGELESSIRDEISNNNLENNVILLSNRYDVNELYQAMDVFVLPSLYEGLPVAGIEAQASGLPCVFADTITKKVDVTGHVYFYSLNEQASKWAEFIDIIMKQYKREDSISLIEKAGYAANVEAKKLQNIYLELVKQPE